jgi:hypothetical protein
MDYNKEVTRLESSQFLDWFKAQAGQYSLTILEEPEEVERVFTKDGVTETKQLLSLKIRTHDNLDYQWDIGKGVSFNSVYGQLMLLGKKFGKLKGVTFTLLVKRARDKNEYTIPEAIPLIAELQKNKV